MAGNSGLGKVLILSKSLGWLTEYLWPQRQYVVGMRACSCEAGLHCSLLGLGKVLVSMLVRCPLFWDYHVSNAAAVGCQNEHLVRCPLMVTMLYTASALVQCDLLTLGRCEALVLVASI